ncbi:LysR family transcriptional regulator [Novosphingobium flavum]|uniref:LysR family transcriptional regulator n=1 Tax=Novosphingobium flavum TaxID=1778672 RepID=A0A7X1FRY7_9SPHN|nr:LysR family transcriptional regulator [Novosphingobium flavum]MBC2665257.1 LysR family transcriptional regulator [Novosphingobium flavum]
MPAFSRFLRYFMAVGRLGSIRKAAEELNVSASAIDRQILNVEAEIGMPLFERLPTGLRLTAAGEIMMAAGGRWHKTLGEVRAQIEDLRGLKRGHVDIAIIDALTKGAIPAAVQSIQSRYPGISIGVKVASNDLVRRMIVTNEVDFGIFFEPESYRDITVRAFVDVHLGFVTPAGYPFGQQREARFSACIGSPVVVPAPPLAVHQQVAVLEGATKATLDRKVSSDNIQMITSLVLQGVGIGILTSLDVLTEVKAGLLSFTRITDPVLRPMTLALCTAAARSPSYAADIVLGEMQAALGQLAWPSPVQAG